ncbi:MAG: thioesterase family protein [Marinilabiliales bacterium]
MDIKIPVDIEFSSQFIVEEKHTAAKLGSGLLEVLSTPAMIAWMEKTSMETIQRFLPEGYGSVGVLVNVEHLKATPIGKTVICTAKVFSVDNRKISFKVTAKQEDEIIGRGFHDRFIINNEKFLKKISD